MNMLLSDTLNHISQLIIMISLFLICILFLVFLYLFYSLIFPKDNDILVIKTPKKIKIVSGKRFVFCFRPFERMLFSLNRKNNQINHCLAFNIDKRSILISLVFCFEIRNETSFCKKTNYSYECFRVKFKEEIDNIFKGNSIKKAFKYLLNNETDNEFILGSLNKYFDEYGILFTNVMINNYEIFDI